MRKREEAEARVPRRESMVVGGGEGEEEGAAGGGVWGGGWKEKEDGKRSRRGRRSSGCRIGLGGGMINCASFVPVGLYVCVLCVFVCMEEVKVGVCIVYCCICRNPFETLAKEGGRK